MCDIDISQKLKTACLTKAPSNPLPVSEIQNRAVYLDPWKIPKNNQDSLPTKQETVVGRDVSW